MVRKVMVYGKQKTEKLAIAFEDLSVTSTTSNGMRFSVFSGTNFNDLLFPDLYINTSRPALTPITDNPRCGPSQERNVVLDGASHNETPKKSKYSPLLKEFEICLLTFNQSRMSLVRMNHG